MTLTIVVAVSDNNVIGINGKIPWRIPEDMKRFKELTIGYPVIMGRKTYDSLPQKFKPLPDRKNIVLSKSLENQNGIYLARTIDEALTLAENEDAYIIGGEKVYRDFLPLTSKLELTRVHKNYEGDAFFPEIDLENWELVMEDQRLNENLRYSFLRYVRK